MNQNSTQELKLVKKASIEKQGHVIKIRHYDTIIFAYDTKSENCYQLKNCSVTSNRQIQYAIEFFKPSGIFRTELNPEKWSFSGDRTN